MLVLCVRSLNNFDLPFWGGNEHVFNILITFVKMQNILQFSAKDFASLHELCPSQAGLSVSVLFSLTLVFQFFRELLVRLLAFCPVTHCVI